MFITVKSKYLRIAPRKVRLITDLIRGKRVEEALKILNFTTKKANLPLLKLLNQAVACAKNDFQIDLTNLFISKITVDEGPKYKRWRARARGQASAIQKKVSHITLVLSEIVGKAKKIKEVKKTVKRERLSRKAKSKFRPTTEMSKPKIEKGIKRIFRRKAF